MVNKVYIGLDNGISGFVSCISNNEITHIHVPTKKELSYTKEKKNITRIDYFELVPILRTMRQDSGSNVFCLMERPYVNSGGFNATMSAIRALEATLIALELLAIPYGYCDSKEWQKMLLPSGIVNNKELKRDKKRASLKKAAVDIAKRLFPSIETNDADSLLIAEYARRRSL